MGFIAVSPYLLVPSNFVLQKAQGGFGTSTHGMPIIAIGPHGGKIVGHDSHGDPIYADSQAAGKLWAHAQELAAAKEEEHDKHVLDWLTTLGFSPVHSSGVVGLAKKDALKLQQAWGTLLSGTSDDGKWSIGKPLGSGAMVGFTTKELLSHVGKPLTPHAQHLTSVAAALASGSFGKAGPWAKTDLTTLTMAQNAGGGHGHTFTVVNALKKLIGYFKKDDLTICRAEEAATRLGHLVFPKPELLPRGEVVKIDGKTGVLLTPIEGKVLGSESSGHGVPPALIQKHFLRLVQHQVFDWLVGNHDSHGANFLVTESGDVAAIDKGQAFKFITNSGMTPESKGPGNGSNPVYQQLWSQYDSGKVPEADVIKAVEEVLTNISKVSSEQLHQIVAPYVEQTGKPGIWDKIKARHEDMVSNWETFLASKLGHSVTLKIGANAKEQAQPATLMPLEVPAPVPVTKPKPKKQSGPSGKVAVSGALGASAPADPVALVAQLPTAPVVAPEPAPAVVQMPGWPLTKGKVTIHHPGAPAPAGVKWNAKYPGPGFHAQVTYKGKDFKYEFSHKDGYPHITVSMPEGGPGSKWKVAFETDSFAASSDFVVLVEKGLPYNLTATEKKAKGVSYTPTKLFKLDEFADELAAAASTNPLTTAEKTVAQLVADKVVLPETKQLSVFDMVSAIPANTIVTDMASLPADVQQFLATHKVPAAEPHAGIVAPPHGTVVKGTLSDGTQTLYTSVTKPDGAPQFHGWIVNEGGSVDHAILGAIMPAAFQDTLAQWWTTPPVAAPEPVVSGNPEPIPAAPPSAPAVPEFVPAPQAPVPHATVSAKAAQKPPKLLETLGAEHSPALQAKVKALWNAVGKLSPKQQQKPSGWAEWVPPPGVVFEGSAGGKPVYAFVDTAGFAEDGEQSHVVGFTVIHGDGEPASGYASLNAGDALDSALAFVPGAEAGFTDVFNISGMSFPAGSTFAVPAAPKASTVVDTNPVDIAPAEKTKAVSKKASLEDVLTLDATKKKYGGKFVVTPTKSGNFYVKFVSSKSMTNAQATAPLAAMLKDFGVSPEHPPTPSNYSSGTAYAIVSPSALAAEVTTEMQLQEAVALPPEPPASPEPAAAAWQPSGLVGTQSFDSAPDGTTVTIPKADFVNGQLVPTTYAKSGASWLQIVNGKVEPKAKLSTGDLIDGAVMLNKHVVINGVDHALDLGATAPKSAVVPEKKAVVPENPAPLWGAKIDEPTAQQLKDAPLDSTLNTSSGPKKKIGPDTWENLVTGNLYAGGYFVSHQGTGVVPAGTLTHPEAPTPKEAAPQTNTFLDPTEAQLKDAPLGSVLLTGTQDADGEDVIHTKEGKDLWVSKTDKGGSSSSWFTDAAGVSTGSVLKHPPGAQQPAGLPPGSADASGKTYAKEHLDALPIGTVIDDGHSVLEKVFGGWKVLEYGGKTSSKIGKVLSADAAENVEGSPYTVTKLGTVFGKKHTPAEVAAFPLNTVLTDSEGKTATKTGPDSWDLSVNAYEKFEDDLVAAATWFHTEPGTGGAAPKALPVIKDGTFGMTKQLADMAVGTVVQIEGSDETWHKKGSDTWIAEDVPDDSNTSLDLVVGAGASNDDGEYTVTVLSGNVPEKTKPNSANYSSGEMGQFPVGTVLTSPDFSDFIATKVGPGQWNWAGNGSQIYTDSDTQGDWVVTSLPEKKVWVAPSKGKLPKTWPTAKTAEAILNAPVGTTITMPTGTKFEKTTETPNGNHDLVWKKTNADGTAANYATSTSSLAFAIHGNGATLTLPNGVAPAVIAPKKAPPKAKPAAPKPIDPAIAAKLAQAKAYLEWKKTAPVISGASPTGKALAQLQATLPAGTALYAHQTPSGLVLGSPTADGLAHLTAALAKLGLAGATVSTPLGDMIATSGLQQKFPEKAPVTGPDGQSYPHGTTFTTEELPLSFKGDDLAKEPGFHKVANSATKPDSLEGVIKFQFPGLDAHSDEAKQKALGLLAKHGIVPALQADGTPHVVGSTSVVVFLSDKTQLAEPAPQKTKLVPHIPEAAKPFSAAQPAISVGILPQGAPAHENKADFALIDTLTLQAWGHTVRMGDPGVLRGSQIKVKRVKREGGEFYEVMGDLMDFNSGKSKLLSGKITWETKSGDSSPFKKDKGVHTAGSVLMTYAGFEGSTGEGTSIQVGSSSGGSAWGAKGTFLVRIPVGADYEAELQSALTLAVGPEKAAQCLVQHDEALHTKFIKAAVVRAGIGASGFWDKDAFGDALDPTKYGDEAWLDKQLTKLKLTSKVASAKVEIGPGGSHHVVLDDITDDDIASKGVKFLSTGIGAAWVVEHLGQGQGAPARRQGFFNGTSKKSPAAEADMNTGGAWGTMTRVMRAGMSPTDYSLGGDEATRFIYHPRVLKRADYYFHNDDAFGATSSKAKSAGNWGPAARRDVLDASASDNECLFQDGVALRDIAGVSCTDTTARTKSLDLFKKKFPEINEINGIQLEDFFFVVSGHNADDIVKKCKGLQPGVLP